MIRLRDYDDAITVLGRERRDQGVPYLRLAELSHRDPRLVRGWLGREHYAQGPGLFDIARGLGYDLALIKREDT